MIILSEAVRLFDDCRGGISAFITIVAVLVIHELNKCLALNCYLRKEGNRDGAFVVPDERSNRSSLAYLLRGGRGNFASAAIGKREEFGRSRDRRTNDLFSKKLCLDRRDCRFILLVVLQDAWGKISARRFLNRSQTNL